MDFALSILEQGLIYGILALGVYITYKILDFPDLTVDGSFPLGSAVTAALLTKGVNPYLSLLIAFLAGVLAGTCTGLIHVKGKVRDLLSGIIMMTALYTVNLMIAGSNNVPLFAQDTIFSNSFLEGITGGNIPGYAVILLILLVALISKLLLFHVPNSTELCKLPGRLKGRRTGCYVSAAQDYLPPAWKIPPKPIWRPLHSCRMRAPCHNRMTPHCH